MFFVGMRWSHHAKVSGYDAIVRHLGAPIEAPAGGRYPWLDEATSQFVKVAGLGARVDRLCFRLKEGYSLPLLRMEFSVFRHMLRRRGAVYHVLYADTDLFLLGYLGRLTRNLVVGTFHDIHASERSELQARVVRTLSGLVLLGACQLPFFRQAAPRVALGLIPHPIDIDFFRPSADGNVRDRGRPRVILTAGGHQRDHATLARAFDLVAERRADVRFVAIGANVGNYSVRLDGPMVEHLSGVPDIRLRDLYRDADVAVFAFKSAVASNSVLEALACGLPVVATDVGGVSEYVGPESGFLVPPEDPVAMADAILAVLGDDAGSHRMRVAARRDAEGFATEIVAARLRDFYRDLARGKAAPIVDAAPWEAA